MNDFSAFKQQIASKDWVSLSQWSPRAIADLPAHNAILYLWDAHESRPWWSLFERFTTAFMQTIMVGLPPASPGKPQHHRQDVLLASVRLKLHTRSWTDSVDPVLTLLTNPHPTMIDMVFQSVRFERLQVLQKNIIAVLSTGCSSAERLLALSTAENAIRGFRLRGAISSTELAPLFLKARTAALRDAGASTAGLSSADEDRLIFAQKGMAVDFLSSSQASIRSKELKDFFEFVSVAIDVRSPFLDELVSEVMMCLSNAAPKPRESSGHTACASDHAPLLA